MRGEYANETSISSEKPNKQAPAPQATNWQNGPTKKVLSADLTTDRETVSNRAAKELAPHDRSQLEQQIWDLKNARCSIADPHPSDKELLRLLLSLVTEEPDTQFLKDRLLDRFGAIPQIVNASSQSLRVITGTHEDAHFAIRLVDVISKRLGRAKILHRKVLDTPETLEEYCRTAIGHRGVENLRVLFLDNRLAVIADEHIATGTANFLPFHPRVVAKRALELDSNAIILVHNHPSGDPTPSISDRQMTRLTVATCAAIGIKVVEHLIITTSGSHSFRRNGDLG